MEGTNAELAVEQISERAKGKKDFSVLDLLRVPAFVIGKDQRVVYANDTFAEMVGRGRDQVVGTLLGSMLRGEVSAVERALQGESARIFTWADVGNKKYFLECIPTPLTDNKGNITGAITVLKDNTDQQMLLMAVQDMVEKAKEGDLQARAEIEAEGDYKNLVEGINELLDTIMVPVQEAQAVLMELAKGNLEARVVGDYKGDYAIIKNALNESMEVLQGYIDQIGTVLDQMTEQKNLDVEITMEFRGDFHALKDAVNNIANRLSRLFTGINTASDQVATGSQQVAEVSQSLAQGAAEAASSLEEIASSVQQLTAQTEHNSENAAQANQLAAQSRVAAEKGDSQMAQMVKAMGEISESSNNISKIIKAIDDIAFQTNLLALNAAVEAARAGKHGKGFTVVAEEVRNLAQRSADAAKETAEMIEDSIKKADMGIKIAEETNEALNGVITGAAKVADLVGEIDSASKEQAQGIAEINQALSQLDQVTQEVSASSEESAAASEELSGQAYQLREMLSIYKLRQEVAAVSAGLPAGVTPEMLQMLQKMMAEQETSAANAAQSPKAAAKSKAANTEDIVIELDDTDFGRF